MIYAKALRILYVKSLKALTTNKKPSEWKGNFLQPITPNSSFYTFLTQLWMSQREHYEPTGLKRNSGLLLYTKELEKLMKRKHVKNKEKLYRKESQKSIGSKYQHTFIIVYFTSLFFKILFPYFPPNKNFPKVKTIKTLIISSSEMITQDHRLKTDTIA